MSIIRCPNCKHKISSKSKKCAYCGCSIAENRDYFDWPLFYLTITGAIFLIIIVSMLYFQGILQGIFLGVMTVVILLNLILVCKMY